MRNDRVIKRARENPIKNLHRNYTKITGRRITDLIDYHYICIDRKNKTTIITQKKNKITNSIDFVNNISSKNPELFIDDGWINGVKDGLQHNCNIIHCKKIIAGIEGLPSIDWNGLEEEFGWIDVDLSKLCYYDKRNPYFSIKREYGYDKEEVESTGDFSKNDCFCDNCFYGRSSLSEQIIKLKSLNDKKFSLELQKAFEVGRKLTIDGFEKEDYKDYDEFIKSLSKPKVFDVEIETKETYFRSVKDINGIYYDHEYTIEPKITNNKIKILKKL